jgi:hypothetical protein
MDEESNRSQHKDLFKRADNHEGRILKLELTHKHTLEKLSMGGIVIVFLADKLGIWEKLFS